MSKPVKAKMVKIEKDGTVILKFDPDDPQFEDLMKHRESMGFPFPGPGCEIIINGIPCDD